MHFVGLRYRTDLIVGSKRCGLSEGVSAGVILRGQDSCFSLLEVE